VEKVIEALEAKKAVDVRVLDLRKVANYADYLVVCSGTSTTHVNALVETVIDEMPKRDKPVYVNNSKDNSWWILDFVDVVLHVFREDTRAYYDLEGLWSDAESVTPV